MSQFHTRITERDQVNSRLTVEVVGIEITFCESEGMVREVSILGSTDVSRGARRAARWRACREFERWRRAEEFVSTHGAT